MNGSCPVPAHPMEEVISLLSKIATNPRHRNTQWAALAQRLCSFATICVQKEKEYKQTQERIVRTQDLVRAVRKYVEWIDDLNPQTLERQRDLWAAIRKSLEKLNEPAA